MHCSIQLPVLTLLTLEQQRYLQLVKNRTSSSDVIWFCQAASTLWASVLLLRESPPKQPQPIVLQDQAGGHICCWILPCHVGLAFWRPELRAFEAVRARTSAASWSFRACACCKFFISAKVILCALSWGRLGTGVDWSTNDRDIFSSCRCRFELAIYTRSGINTKRRRKQASGHVNTCSWNSSLKRHCRTLKVTVLGPYHVLPVSIGISPRPPYIPFHPLCLLTQIKHCVFPRIK